MNIDKKIKFWPLVSGLSMIALVVMSFVKGGLVLGLIALLVYSFIMQLEKKLK